RAVGRIGEAIVMTRRTATVLLATAFAAALTAGDAGAHGRDIRALLKCQRTVSSEGMLYASRMNTRMARCIDPLAECALDPSSTIDDCPDARSQCLRVAVDVAELETRLRSRIVAGCGGLPLEKMLGEMALASQLRECSGGTMDGLARCLASNLRW